MRVASDCKCLPIKHKSQGNSSSKGVLQNRNPKCS